MPVTPSEPSHDSSSHNSSSHNFERDYLASSPPSAAEVRQKERKRRRRELIFAAFAFIAVLFMTVMQLEQFRSGSSLFMIMFNVNFFLMAGIMVVVLRNGVKLLLERRRRVLGSRLRTRLVLAFVALALMPCLLMFLVTTKYVQLSIDFWFKVQVESSMETALDTVRRVYDQIGDDLAYEGKAILAESSARGFLWAGRDMDSLMEQKRREYRLSAVGIYTAEGRQRSWHGVAEANAAWPFAVKELNWAKAQSAGTAHAVVEGPESDFIFTAYRQHDGKDYIILARNMGPGFKAAIDRIVRGSGEYKNLRKTKKPLKIMLYSSLGVLTILIIMGATWFGFRLARELSAPILALASGTQRIARGDLSVRLDDVSSDEFGMLIRSFNAMAEDLEQSRLSLTDANALLESQNIRIANHSNYIETVLDNIAAGVISFDQHGAINTANRSARDMLGLDPEDLVGNNIKDLLLAAGDGNTPPGAEALLRNPEENNRYDIRLTINKEERHFVVTVVSFSSDGSHRGSVAVFEDISELERMQRMAAWREVARRIAHEIKNPLTPIKLSAQRLARKFGEQVKDPAFTQSTQVIVRQVEHLQNMVQEFSAFAKLPEVVLSPGDLAPLLSSVTDLFRNSHTHIEWQLDMPDHLPQIPMDKDALTRALMNIYTNAAEVLAQAVDGKVSTTVSLLPKLNLVRIMVADNGHGLTEEELSRLFEPYFSRKKGGTGLGLAIVRSIVTDHRGYIRGMQRDGGGTLLIMELPLA